MPEMCPLMLQPLWRLELESIFHTLSLESCEVFTELLTWGLRLMQLQLIGLVKHLNQVKDAAVRQLQTGLERLTGERRKKSQYSAELGNHTVIYKVCLTPHLTWPFCFYYCSTRLVSEEEKAEECFITCYIWNLERSLRSYSYFTHVLKAKTKTMSLCLVFMGHFSIQMEEIWPENKFWKCFTWCSLMCHA